MKPLLKIDNLSFGYTKERLLYEDFSLTLCKGELKAIVGASGAGKSTLFELILGNLKPLKGAIQVTGKISEVFQDPYTSFHPSYTIINQIEDVAKTTNLQYYLKLLTVDEALLHKLPHELSGGQLQRCSILRAIKMEPKLLLADEPTSALDNVTSLKVMKLLLRYLDRVGILLITHDMALAKWCADRIIELSRA